MQRISTPTRVIDKHGTGRDGFGDGNPQAGTPSTQLEAAWYDSSQEEIARAIELEGITLDPADMTQLHQAMLRVGGRYLPLTGGTLAGPGNLTVNGTLILGGDPVIPLEATTKQYVDTFLPLAGGTMDLVVPFTINTQAVGGVIITANAGENAGLAIRTPADGNFSAQVSFTVGSRSYHTGVAGNGVFVINDVSAPIPHPGLIRFSIDALGDVSINNALTVGATLNVGGGIIMGTGGQAGLIVYGSALKTPPALWEELTTGVEQIVLDPYTHGLEIIRQLDPVNCRYVVAPPYNNDEREAEIHPGLSCENIAAVLPQMLRTQTVQRRADTAPERTETINYHALTYVLINAVKELADRVEALEAAL